MEVSVLLVRKKNVFGEQEIVEDRIQLESVLLQICINIVLAIIIFFTFCSLRSKYPEVYESKRSSKSEVLQRPEPLKQGWFVWIYTTFKLTDGDLLQYSNFDGFTFVYYLRTLRKLVTIMTLICVSVLLPLNVVASYHTGIWPPSPGLNFLTLSNINYPDHDSNSDVWFWCPSVACWLFSVIVVAQMVYSSNCFLIAREKYRTTLKKSASAIESLISRTLLIRVDRISQGDEKIKYVIDHFSNAICQQIVFGQYNERTAYLVKEYNKILQKLEIESQRKEKGIVIVFFFFF
ncbi:late exocytosis, associated with Golgi transport-domain-containing protein [Sporodiniella umbellata]|nr:late exocytosis, associated with Golgi transport-domain-containing protein [Sporodiniella umbellata]